jgi:hypothetical protein
LSNEVEQRLLLLERMVGLFFFRVHLLRSWVSPQFDAAKQASFS